MTYPSLSLGQSAFTVREYGQQRGDWQKVDEWWQAHRSDIRLVETLLPPLGVMVELNGVPVAAMWLHLSAGIGVAFLENPVTSPGLTPREAITAMGIALGALKSAAKKHNYGVMVANAPIGIAAVLKKEFGFDKIDDRQKLTMAKEI